MNDDAQLIHDTLTGNAAAFGELVCRYQDRLYNAVVHVVGSADEARDVVQDAFVQAFVKLETFQHKSAFYTWLYRIAFNVSISRRRRQRPVVSIDYTRQTSGHEPADMTAPAERLERQERAGQVQEALSRLSEEHRAILVLREIEGCSYEAISEVLQLPVGTVRSRLHRARLQMRDQLQETLGDERD